MIEKEIRVKSNGELFGYTSLMNKDLRSTTMVALTDCFCFILSEDDFDKTINVNYIKKLLNY